MKEKVKIKIIIEATYDAAYYEETDPLMIVEDVLADSATVAYLDPGHIPVAVNEVKSPEISLDITGAKLQIPVRMIEFYPGQKTFWISGRHGGTILRVKTRGRINTDVCGNSPYSHCDIIVDDDINFCISTDAANP